MKIFKVLLLSCVLLLVINCSEDRIEEASSTGTITGVVVTGDDNERVADARISTTPSTSTVFTDEEGSFTITNVPEGTYSVQASKNDFVTTFESANVLANVIIDLVIDFVSDSALNDAPTVPQLVFPEDGAQDIALEVEFTWSSQDLDNDEITYTLQLRNGLTQEIQDFEVVQDTFFIVSDLMFSTNYFWEVTANDQQNDPVTSSIGEFTTTTQPNNSFFFTRIEDGNNVIFSGDENDESTEEINQNVFQLTDLGDNSFKPLVNSTVNKVAFLKNVGGETHIFTMNLDGTNEQQVTSTVPLGGFRIEEIGFSWAQDGGSLYYPSFDKLYKINVDGSSRTLVYQTTDGSLVSEIVTPQFNEDLVVLKTNNLQGYEVRIFTFNMATGTEEHVILENTLGASLSIDVSADGNTVLYSRDISESENPDYRIFTARMFLHNITEGTTEQIMSNAIPGENDYQCRFSPSEGGLIFTRQLNNPGAIPAVYSIQFGDTDVDTKLFEPGFFPDWG